MRITPVLAGLGLVVLLATTACTSAGDTAATSAKGPIAVEATDAACKVERTEDAAGTIEFTVRNTGSKVNEFYVYGEGDQVIGEVENLTPGLTRTLHVDGVKPGTYQTACKPGMKGNGIRADFTVTGATTS